MNTDYILRLLEQLSAAIAAISSAREGGRLKEAGEQIASRCLEQTGLPFELVERLPAMDLEILLATGGDLRIPRSLWLGELLAEHGEITLRAGNPPGAALAFDRAHHLIASVLNELGATEKDHFRERLHLIATRLRDLGIEPAIHR